MAICCVFSPNQAKPLNNEKLNKGIHVDFHGNPTFWIEIKATFLQKKIPNVIYL